MTPYSEKKLWTIGQSSENNEDDWEPTDEETPNKRRRSRSRSSSGSSEEEERNGTDVMAPPRLPPPVTDAKCHQEVCDTSAFAKKVVRNVMGDPKNRRQFPGMLRFSKLSGNDHGLRAYFCPCMRYSNVQSQPIAFFPCLNYNLETIFFQSAQGRNCMTDRRAVGPNGQQSKVSS